MVDEQMLDRSRVVAQHGALAYAESAVLSDDDSAGSRAARRRFLDRLAAARSRPRLRVPRGELFDQAIDARLEIARG